MTAETTATTPTRASNNTSTDHDVNIRSDDENNNRQHRHNSETSVKQSSILSLPDDDPISSVHQDAHASSSQKAPGLGPTKEPTRWLDRCPDWFLEHLTARDFKILFRASLAAWASFLFVVINPVLKNFGQAAFLGMLVLFINPPAVVLPLYLLAALTILFGMCLAWGWGSLAYLAQVAVRDDDAYYATYNSIIQAARQTPSPQLYAQRQIFNGELLQTAPTVVMLTMSCILLYFLARLQASFPKLVLVNIFGTIVIDTYITTAPLVNKFNGLLPLVFVKPLASAVGIGLVLSILVFPESCSHATLAMLSKSLSRSREILKITKSTLENLHADIPTTEIKKLKKKIVDEHAITDQNFTFIGLEPSMGRWSGEDVKSLKAIFQDVFIRGTVMLNFHLLRQEYRSKVLRNTLKDGSVLGTDPMDHESADKINDSEESIKEKKHRHHRHVAQTQTLATLTVYEFLRPEPEVLTLGQEALRAVEDVSAPLLKTCDDALIASIEIIDIVNNNRWFGCPKNSDLDKLVEKHTRALNNLKYEQKEFSLHAVDKMVGPVSHFFGEDGKLLHSTEKDRGVRLPGLMIGMNYKHRILAFTGSVIDVLERLVKLEAEKKTAKFWMPFALKGLFSWAFSPEPLAEDNVIEKNEKKERKSKKQDAKQNKKQQNLGELKSKPINRRRSKVARALTGIYHWFLNSEGVFAIRVVIVTLALTVPGVVKPSAAFCYDNRAIWALIMAQLTITQFMGDFVFSVAMRTIGTIIGGVFGLAVWYIGSGSGPGNPYGIMAILAPFILISMMFRVWAPQEWLMPSAMGLATLMLVVGYSWEISYLPSLIQQEPGYGIFYRRLLLVMVGFGVAILVQVFPRPPSATRNASKALSVVLSHISSFYAEILSNYFSELPQSDAEARGSTETRVTELYTEMQELLPHIKMVKFEPSSSPYTCDILLEIEECMGKILESLSIISFASSRLNPIYRRRLEVQTDFIQTETISSIMAVLGVLEGALKTGHPLSEFLPVPLLGRLRKLSGPANGIDTLSKDMMKDEEWSLFVVALMAVTSLFSRIDDLVMTVKSAVGEKYHIAGLPQSTPHHRHVTTENYQLDNAV